MTKLSKTFINEMFELVKMHYSMAEAKQKLRDIVL